MIKDRHILIKNIYYMLSYAFRVLQQKEYQELETESFEHAKDLLAAILAKAVALQLKGGLLRDYIKMTDDLAGLRGKIRLRESIHHQIKKSKKLACEFDEYSENHLMNQILKTTMFHLLSDKDVQDSTKQKIKRSYLYFNEVGYIEPSSIKWKTLQYHRHNATYRMLMSICNFILKDLLLTTEEGTQKLAGFLDDQSMARLFEKFLLEFYKKHYPQLRPEAKQIEWDVDGNTHYLPSMKTDIMLRDGNKKLIIDAKYYSRMMQHHYDNYSIHSANLYQIYAYVKNEDKNQTGKISGMLLYARTDEAVAPKSSYDMKGNIIHVRTLDLNTSFNSIKKQLDTFVTEWKSEDEGNKLQNRKIV